MAANTDELKEALSKVDIEEQREILKKFAETNTDNKVLEGIRIANETLSMAHQEVIITSYVRK
jgi:hypothetical protein